MPTFTLPINVYLHKMIWKVLFRYVHEISLGSVMIGQYNYVYVILHTYTHTLYKHTVMPKVGGWVAFHYSTTSMCLHDSLPVLIMLYLLTSIHI